MTDGRTGATRTHVREQSAAPQSRSEMTQPDAGEFEVFLRHLVEELGTVADSLQGVMERKDRAPWPELTDLWRRVEALKRYYDFMLGERRQVTSTAAGLQAGEAELERRGRAFIGAELERGRRAAARSQRDYQARDTTGGRREQSDAVMAHAEAGRRLDRADARGWEIGALRDQLDQLGRDVG